MFDWENNFESHILDRGWQYMQAGAVSYLIKRDNEIDALVQGSECYNVHIRYDGHAVSDAYCSCPYAAKGYWCKHIAAVLYKADMGADSAAAESLETRRFPDEIEVTPVSEMIREADKSRLEEILIHLAASDDKVESYIRAMLAGSRNVSDLHEMEQEVDTIFSSYSEYDGYIRYREAFEFARDLCTYLQHQADSLIHEERFLDAFHISTYAYYETGNCEIDDDGEISDICRTCYDIWLKIIAVCPASDLNRIRSWFLDHEDENDINEYMSDVLREFLEYELASKEELTNKLAWLDSLVEESKTSAKCKGVFTFHYGYDCEAIKLRMILMRRLGAGEDEVDEYRRRYMNFRSVREYYLEKARNENDMDEEIRLLQLSKRIDQDDAYYLYNYSKRLIEIYHIQKDFAREKAERRESYLLYIYATIEDFREYRAMCTDEEWKKERTVLIYSRNDTDTRCSLLVEERMMPELFAEIWKEEEKIQLLNKYGFCLADLYPEHILEEYTGYVSDIAADARNRSSYQEIIRYLKRMEQYPGGRKVVRDLCRQWIAAYPTRKVMVRELQSML